MNALPDLTTLTDDEISALLGRLEDREDAISRRRRLMHGRIDILRGERTERLRTRVAQGTLPDLPLPDTLERPLFAGDGVVEETEELPALPDLASISDDDLRQMIRELEQEEDDVSLERRVLHGQIDIVRAERAKRSRSGSHVEASDLGSILGGTG